jgi:hypothetical protein
MKQVPKGIAANTPNIKRLENKNFWQTAPKTKTLAFYTQKCMHNRALQHWLI